jgi:gas vesicle protein
MYGKFLTGMVVGGIITAAGISCLVTEPKTRRRAMRDGKRLMQKAGDCICDIF